MAATHYTKNDYLEHRRLYNKILDGDHGSRRSSQKAQQDANKVFGTHQGALTAQEVHRREVEQKVQMEITLPRMTDMALDNDAPIPATLATTSSLTSYARGRNEDAIKSNANDRSSTSPPSRSVTNDAPVTPSQVLVGPEDDEEYEYPEPVTASHFSTPYFPADILTGRDQDVRTSSMASTTQQDKGDSSKFANNHEHESHSTGLQMSKHTKGYFRWQHIKRVTLGEELPQSVDEAELASQLRFDQMVQQYNPILSKGKVWWPDMMPEFFDVENFEWLKGEVDSVRCFCGCIENDGKKMIKCSDCGVWQHMKCMKDGVSSDIHGPYYCHVCSPITHAELLAEFRRNNPLP